MQNLGLPRSRGKVNIVPEISISAAVARVSSSANILTFLVIASSCQKCAFPQLHPIKKILAEVLNPREKEPLFQSRITNKKCLLSRSENLSTKKKVAIIDLGGFRYCLFERDRKVPKTF